MHWDYDEIAGNIGLIGVEAITDRCHINLNGYGSLSRQLGKPLFGANLRAAYVMWNKVTSFVGGYGREIAMPNDVVHYKGHYTPHSMTLLASYPNGLHRLRYGITAGIEFDYKTHHKIGVGVTYDNLTHGALGVKYQFTRADTAVAKTPLLPLPHYHVGPPIEWVVWSAERAQTERQSLQALKAQFTQSLQAEINTYVERLGADYDWQTRYTALTLWTRCDPMTRQRIQLWPSVRQALSKKGIPNELQLMIRDRALLDKTDPLRLEQHDHLSNYDHFYRQGYVEYHEVMIMNPMGPMQSQHLDLLTDHLSAIRHDKSQMLGFMTGFKYYGTSTI